MIIMFSKQQFGTDGEMLQATEMLDLNVAYNLS